MSESREMIRALNFAYTFPFPPHGGYDLRVVNLARNLARHLEQTLLCRSLEPLQPAALEASREVYAHIHALHLPRPRLHEKLAKALSFLSKPYPLMSAGWYFRPLAKQLEALLSDGSFELIVMDGIWLCPYWPIIARSSALKVLSLHNLPSELIEREAKTRSSALQGLLYTHDAMKMRRVERRIAGTADLVLVTSERERSVLLEENPRINVSVISNGVDSDGMRPLPLAKRREILFVGAFSYFPNVDAVVYFANEVFPAIRRKLPDITFRVVGRSPGAEISALDQRDGITVTGDVESVEPSYQQAALCVAPIRAGSGTRLKILEAMAFGRPVVSTTMGCEGLEVEPGRHILVEDAPGRMAEAICELLENGSLYERLAREGRGLVETKYSWAQIADGLFGEYEKLLEGNRRRRATGS